MLGSKDDLNSRFTVCFLLGDITKHSDCENIDCDKWYKGCLWDKFIFSICRIQNENVRLLLTDCKDSGTGTAECLNRPLLSAISVQL